MPAPRTVTDQTIQAIRQQWNGMNHTELAKQYGISKQYVLLIGKGKVRPTVGNV